MFASVYFCEAGLYKYFFSDIFLLLFHIPDFKYVNYSKLRTKTNTFKLCKDVLQVYTVLSGARRGFRERNPNITSIDLPSLLTVSVSQTYTGLLIKSTMKTPALRRAYAQFCLVKRCISSSDFNVAFIKAAHEAINILRL